MDTCSKCGGSGPLANLRSWCKACEVKRVREWRLKNLEKAKAYQATYYQEHQDKGKIRSRQWRENHPVEAKDYHAAWCEANSERVRELHHDWYEANKDGVKEKVRAFKKAHPELVAAARHRRRAKAKTFDDGTLRHFRHESHCQYCGVELDHSPVCNHAKGVIEHIIPICDDGPNSLANVCSACWKCNSKKAQRSVDQFAAEEFGLPIIEGQAVIVLEGHNTLPICHTLIQHRWKMAAFRAIRRTNESRLRQDA